MAALAGAEVEIGAGWGAVAVPAATAAAVEAAAAAAAAAALPPPLAPPPGAARGLPAFASSNKCSTSCCDSGRASHCRNRLSSFILEHGKRAWPPAFPPPPPPPEEVLPLPPTPLVPAAAAVAAAAAAAAAAAFAMAGP